MTKGMKLAQWIEQRSQPIRVERSMNGSGAALYLIQGRAIVVHWDRLNKWVSIWDTHREQYIMRLGNRKVRHQYARPWVLTPAD